MFQSLRFLTLTVGIVLVGCEADTRGLTELTGTDSGPTGSVDGAIALDATVTIDAGEPMIDCGGPNPAGCVVNACPPTLVCDQNLGCEPSSCVCTETGWTCTRDCGGGVCRPTELTFRFSYSSDVVGDTAFVQTSGGVAPWVAVFDEQGVDQRMDATCDLCPCDQCGNCPVCGQLPATIERVGTIERRWDLVTHRIQRCPNAPGSNRACQGYELLPAGRYVARFCYGYTVISSPGGSVIEQPVCRDVPFEWPTTQAEIEYEVCDCG